MPDEKKPAPASAPAPFVAPDVRALVAKAANDLGLSQSSNRVCLLATIRALAAWGVPQAQRQAAFEWLKANGHGLGCNASQLAQWVRGEKAQTESAASGVEA